MFYSHLVLFRIDDNKRSLILCILYDFFLLFFIIILLFLLFAHICLCEIRIYAKVCSRSLNSFFFCMDFVAVFIFRMCVCVCRCERICSPARSSLAFIVVVSFEMVPDIVDHISHSRINPCWKR